jgi:hypothetical protein
MLPLISFRVYLTERWVRWWTCKRGINLDSPCGTYPHPDAEDLFCGALARPLREQQGLPWSFLDCSRLLGNVCFFKESLLNQSGTLLYFF